MFIFWQDWCAPCRRKGPVLAQLSRDHSDMQFFGVISGSDDDVNEAKVMKLSKKWALPYPQLRDRSGALSDLFGVQGTPTIVILDANGEVVYNAHKLPQRWDF